MATDKRLLYFDGQFLQAADFNDEQAYHLDRLRRHNRWLHTPGIAEGLTVEGIRAATQVKVSPGTALDAEGRLIVLTESRTLQIGLDLAGQSVLVVISYGEEASDPASGAGSETRWHERPEVALVPVSDDPEPGIHIRLASLTIDSGGGIAAAPDESVRVAAGGHLGDEGAVKKLSLKRQGVDESLWPSLSSGAAGRLDVAGDLAVTGAGSVGGGLTVTGAGSVGGDLAVTGNHDVGGGLTVTGAGSVGGDLGVSGNHDVKGGLTVTGAGSVGGDLAVTGNHDVAGTLTVTGAGSVAGGLAVTGATTIAGDLNATGKVNGRDIVQDGDKLDLHLSADNPHGLAAADIGALPLSGYHFARCEVHPASFSKTDTEDKEIELGFTPKFIWVYGGARVDFSLKHYGSTLGGFVNLASGLDDEKVYGMYVQCVRTASAPFIAISSYPLKESFLLQCYFNDQSTSPQKGEHIYVSFRMSNSKPTTIELNFSKGLISGDFNEVEAFEIKMNLICFG